MCVSTSSTSSTTISAIPSTVPRRCCERWSRRGAWAARPVAASMSIAIEAAGLSETQRQIVELAREFARTRIEPHAAEWDRTKHFPRDVIAELGRLGFLGMATPEEADGMGLDAVTYLLALEELAAGDASIAVSVAIHNAIPTTMLVRHGSPPQKERWLKPMARGELLAGFALSEPGSGSDAASLCAQAVRDGADWVLSGAKAWATKGWGSSTPWRGSMWAASGSRSRRWASRAGPWSMPSPTAPSAGSSAGRCASFRRCSSSWPTWPRG